MPPSTHRGSRVRIPSQCFGVTMHLEPGMLKPNGSPWGFPIAKDVPLDPVTAQVPLYPGSVSSHAPLAQNVFMGVSLNNYIKTAVAEYSLPADPATALQWYRKSFAECGFFPDGESGGNPTTAVEFSSSTTSSLHVDVSLEAVSTHSSLVLYYASALSTPKRPSLSEIAGNVTSASVMYSASVPITSKHGPHVRITFHNPSVLADLEYLVARPGVDIGSACVVGGRTKGGGEVVVFHTASGRAERMVVGCSYFTINGSRPIDDASDSVWSYISFLVYQHCFQYGCASLR